jgi:hypothetical protein
MDAGIQSHGCVQLYAIRGFWIAAIPARNDVVSLNLMAVTLCVPFGIRLFPGSGFTAIKLSNNRSPIALETVKVLVFWSPKQVLGFLYPIKINIL